MRKEVIFAVLIGTLFGVVIVLGIKRLNSSVQSENNPQQSSSNQTEQTNDIEAMFLALSTPEEKEVITESTVVLRGITKAGSWVVVTSDDENYISLADETGEFNQEVELQGGINNFSITSFDTSGNSDNQKLTLVHTTNFE